jgi:predicted lipoprotein
MTLEEVQALSDDELNAIMDELTDIHKGYDWVRDLNAMHKAEQSLTGEQFLVYLDNLISITTGTETGIKVILATARQRAEAFVLTKENERLSSLADEILDEKETENK